MPFYYNHLERTICLVHLIASDWSGTSAELPHKVQWHLEARENPMTHPDIYECNELPGRGNALNRRLISGVWTVNSPQSHIVRVYDAGHGKSGVFHSAEWHDGDWSSDGIREAWLWFFIWVESF
ncbi:hypothetical protein TNCV_253141 [Trichonephila clavipes]|nr:hypothetical protein TNCV_253141 [Trichonephila clavipes]